MNVVVDDRGQMQLIEIVPLEPGPEIVVPDS